jgi:hypothetical protein
MINLEGNLKIPAIYDAIFPYNGATWHVRRDGQNGLLDKNGKEVLPVEYSSIWEPSEDICVVVRDEAFYGFCRTDGTMLTEAIYDRTDTFNEGYGHSWRLSDGCILFQDTCNCGYYAEKFAWEIPDLTEMAGTQISRSVVSRLPQINK